MKWAEEQDKLIVVSPVMARMAEAAFKWRDYNWRRIKREMNKAAKGK